MPPAQFRPSQPVWALLDGFPWWPARVVRPHELWLGENEKAPTQRPGEVLVEFFNDDKRFASLSAARLRPFASRKTPANASAQLREAADEAEQYIADTRWRTPRAVPDIPQLAPSESEYEPADAAQDEDDSQPEEAPAPFVPPDPPRSRRTKAGAVARRPPPRARNPRPRSRKRRRPEEDDKDDKDRDGPAPSTNPEEGSAVPEYSVLVKQKPHARPREPPSSKPDHEPEDEQEPVQEARAEGKPSPNGVVLDLVTEDSRTERTAPQQPARAAGAGSERGRMSEKELGNAVYVPGEETGADYVEEHDVAHMPRETDTAHEGDMYQILSKDQVISLLVARERENRLFYHQNQVLRQRVAVLESGELVQNAEDLLSRSKPVFEALGGFLERFAGKGRADVERCTQGSGSRTQDGLT